MSNFCTLFDRNYIVKGLALVNSLVDTMQAHPVILACDDFTYEILSQHTPFEAVHLSAIETPEVLEARASRTWQEYMWTLGSVFLFYCYDHYPGPWAYVDADCFFFRSMEPWCQEAHDCAIIPHRYDRKHQARFARNGRFNVSWVHIGDTPGGRECLQRWCRQCLEWCYYRHDNGKFADQGYLDEWPERYDTLIIEEAGVGLGPWGVLGNHYEVDGPILLVNGAPLVFYHFHGLVQTKRGIYRGGYKIPPVVQRKVYEPYEHRLRCFREQMQSCGVSVSI